MSDLEQYLDAQSGRFEEDLCQLLRIPSISADSAHQTDVAKAADWVLGQFKQLGMKAQRIETAGHPLVYAESAPAPARRWCWSTAITTCSRWIRWANGFHHLSSQPAATGISTPAAPRTIKARCSRISRAPKLGWRPRENCRCQLKYLIEGEEEVGSENLPLYIEGHKRELACDVVVISDCSQFGPGQPAITYGLRGIAYYELRLTGPKQDLHSGTFGGGVTNPANALCRMMTALVDKDGRIQVPGFYDDVLPLSDRERQQFRSLAFDEAAFMKQLGVTALSGEAGYTTLERRSARPTCDINGLWSGYQGEGAKTVLPARAGAKFSFRLVPNQDPKKITAALDKWLRSLLPPGVTMELTDFHGAPGVVVPLESPYVAAADRAIERGFGRRPVFIREGGSIPIVTTFHDLLGADTLLLGWGLDDDNTHSPNEKFNLADFHRGIKASAYLWGELAKISK